MYEQRIKVSIIVPSLEPDNRLLKLLDDLKRDLAKQENLEIEANIIIVDDGSGLGGEYSYIFEEAQKLYDCVVLRHAVNLGKGRALKTAFNYFLNKHPDYHGVITADSDGQHTASDIIKCINELYDKRTIILGCRNFNNKNIPFKSSFGNKLTKVIFAFLCGKKVSDTQTGLRAVPTDLIKKIITVQGERFEYEMNVLAECANRRYKINEVPIETIYIENNKGTHFHPILDSIKIYKIFLKYILSAISSFIIDIALFSIFILLTKEFFIAYIFISTIMARVFSSLFNYFVNKNIVFAGNQSKNSLLKYYGLVLSIMTFSGALTTLLFSLSIFSEVSSKVIIDTILFLLSYYVQKKWIF